MGEIPLNPPLRKGDFSGLFNPHSFGKLRTGLTFPLTKGEGTGSLLPLGEGPGVRAGPYE
jgi:hypothetical protein